MRACARSKSSQARDYLAHSFTMGRGMGSDPIPRSNSPSWQQMLDPFGTLAAADVKEQEKIAEIR